MSYGGHERRHSFDSSSMQYTNYQDMGAGDGRIDYETDCKSRRVRFNDNDFDARYNKSRSRSVERSLKGYRDMSVQETTSRLKESYYNIEKGLMALKKVYEDLSKSKEVLCYHHDHSHKRASISEIESLLKEVQMLEESLRKSSIRKRKYLDELSKLQSILHEDRLKIESVVKTSKDSKRVLRQHMDETTKVTRDQQILITKLKRDNEYLWKILREIQQHLEEEEVSETGSIINNQCYQEEGRQDAKVSRGDFTTRLPSLPRVPTCNEQEMKSFNTRFKHTTISTKNVEDNRCESSGSSDSSNGSSHDRYLSDKVKSLIKQAENIQQMIGNVGLKHMSQPSITDDTRAVQYHSDRNTRHCDINEDHESARRHNNYPCTDTRIASENECGIRSDAKDIIRRCEELERRVEQCSTKDIRDRLIQQLEEIDDSSSKEEFSSYNGERHRNPTPTVQQSTGNQWHPEIHKKVRNELFKCLDQMSVMEKNCSIAQDEISRLRQYIKDTSEKKDFSEKTFKREALQLRLVVEDKSTEIEQLKFNMDEAIKGLKNSEYLLQQIEDLEKVIETKNRDIEQLKNNSSNDCEHLKDKLAEKTQEMERLRGLNNSECLLQQIEVLEKVIETKDRDIEQLKNNSLKDCEHLKDKLAEKTQEMERLRGLNNSECLLQQIEVLEKVIETKDRDVEQLKNDSSQDCEYFKDKLVEKTQEMERLRMDMTVALESIEKLRVTTAMREQYKHVNLEETIGTELSLLQGAITDVDHRMQVIQEENASLHQQLEMKTALLHGINVEKETLTNRLQLCEQESRVLKAKLVSFETEQNISSYFQQDIRIRQLEHDLSKAISEKESVFDSTFRKSDRPETNEQEEVIVSLIDDNEKYLELIQQKDRTLEQLQQRLDILQVETDKKDVINMLDTMQTQPRTQQPDESKYLEIIQRKNKTIEELRANLEAVTAEVDKKLVNELLTALSSKNASSISKDTDSIDDGKRCGIKDELEKIQQLLSASHREMIDKIFTLEEILTTLQAENKVLRKRLEKPKSDTDNTATPTDNLQAKFNRIMDENSTLRDSLNRPYPGLVHNILSQAEEVKRLHEENELLRLGLSDSKKELIDSNLRKRQRIKDLQAKLEDVQQEKIAAGTGLKSRRRSSSLGDEIADCHLDRRSKKREVTSNKELVVEMKNQNKLLQRLEEDNQVLTEKSRNQTKEIKRLNNEAERLRDTTSATKVLQDEVKNLRSALQDMNSADDTSQHRIKQLEEEIHALKDGSKTPASGDEEFVLNRHRLTLGNLDRARNMNPKALYSEYVKAKNGCDKANEDLQRMTKIVQKEKTRYEQLEDKITDLETRKHQLERSLKHSEKDVTLAKEQLHRVEQKLENSHSEECRAKDELANLRNVLKEVNKHKQEEDGVTETIKMLTDNLNALEQERGNVQAKLDQSRQEKNRLERDMSTMKSNIQQHGRDAVNGLEQENEKKNIEIIQLNNELDQIKRENGELQDINEQLVNQLEKIKSEANETQFKEWLEKDAKNRLALLSPDTHRSDYGLDPDDRQYKKDEQRIIRKLQIENQIMKAKLLSMEEENIEATKIISDMERGHGHLTGTLRCHLILQRNTTAKLLEGSLHQYTQDFETLQNKFKSLEEKYDRRKEKSKRRDDGWELFTNAAATIANINTILNEGLVKVEEDLERELEEEEFEDKDYKSRLWILRRRLSDVENRHRELQLRAEELNLRLDAKTTEFEVTQDELEDATRDLESRDTYLNKMKKELELLAKEREKLNQLMSVLKQNEDKLVSDVILESEAFNDDVEKPNPNSSVQNYGTKLDLTDLINKLNERDAALSIMRKMRDETEKESDELKRRIKYLERKLKEMTEHRDKLKKEAEYRAGYMSFARDDHGTIHMLRDDLKRLTNENADLKHDIVLKQRQMYDMSKDLHKLRIQLDLDSSKTEKKYGKKDDALKRMIQDLAELKADKFLLETKLKDAERRIGSSFRNDDAKEEEANMVEIFKQKLSEKEHEIERLKRSASRTSHPNKSPIPSKDDTMSDVLSAFDSFKSDSKEQASDKRRIQELKDENKILKEAVTDKHLHDSVECIKKMKATEKKLNQLRAEISSLNADNDKKRTRIRELLTAVEEMKDGKANKAANVKITKLIEKTKEDEMTSVLEKLKKSKQEVGEWKGKAENYEKELNKLQESPTAERKSSLNYNLMQEQNIDMLLPKTPIFTSNQEPLHMVELMNSSSSNSARDSAEAGKKISESSKKSSTASKIPISPMKRQKPSTKLLSPGSKSDEDHNKDNKDKLKPSSTQRKKWELPNEKDDDNNKDVTV